MKVSIIIPFYDNWTMTHQRMMELYKHIVNPVEIVLVNDCSKDESIDSSVAWWQQNSKHRVKYVKNKKNLGFGKSMNKGVNKSGGDIVVLLSNDVQVTGDFISVILQKLKEDEKVLIGGELHDWNTGWNVLEINGQMKVFPYAAGWLLSCTREVWDDIGGFDSIYEKFDYEDMCLSTMAIHKGYKLVGLNLKFMLRHFSGQTVRKEYPDREKYTLENQKRFIEKWSTILKDEDTC